jgi:hypothetical protein
LSAIFRIHLHSKDLPLLYKIQEFYGGIGFIQVSSSGRSASFNVKKFEDIIKVIMAKPLILLNIIYKVLKELILSYGYSV